MFEGAAVMTAMPLPQKRGPLPAGQRRFMASFRTIAALVLREMATTYGRSPGGYVWAVLEPVAGVAVLSAAFSFALQSPPLGSNFQLFYATGIIPLGMYGAISSRVANALTFSRPLMAYPRVTFVDAILARFVLNMLTQIMVAYLVFAGIMLLYDTKVILNLPAIAGAVALAGVLALGIGTLNCFLFTRFPIWSQIWGVLMKPIFLISCIFMTFDSLPVWARDILWYNPIVHLVGLMRHGFYSTYHASYVSVGYVLGLSAICMVFGLLLLRKHQYSLLNR
jgi:capsular polysaccharide transport system permease protein